MRKFIGLTLLDWVALVVLLACACAAILVAAGCEQGARIWLLRSLDIQLVPAARPRDPPTFGLSENTARSAAI